MVPLTDNPNAPNDCGKTPIHWAARTGHTEIVKILAPLKNNTNAPKSRRNTLSIYWTALNGHMKNVKTLALRMAYHFGFWKETIFSFTKNILMAIFLMFLVQSTEGLLRSE